jgi:putative transposase
VLVTKYRKPCISEEIGSELKIAFEDILGSWNCGLLEYGFEEDHAHLLVDIHPALNISTLINNLKSASSRRIRNRHWNWLRHFYTKNAFWHRAYFVGSVGGATLDTVKRYVAAQGTQEQPQKRPKGRPA